MSDPGNISRRQLLRGRLPKGIVPPPENAAPTRPLVATSSGPVASGRAGGRVFPVVRPPGAVDEPAFLKGCTKCDQCVEACPHDAVTHAPIRFRGAAGTPMIDPAQSPCLMCSDYPCISACPEDALMLEVLGPIASARLLDYNCLAHQGSFCTVCHEQCPAPGAITLDQGRPTVHLDHCTGCGVCHYACPAPTNAIAIMPLERRPTPKGGPDDV
ncbi:4Fe-4S dicluster domain-containing protein [Phycisphaeraceae bacterium D3-23]